MKICSIVGALGLILAIGSCKKQNAQAAGNTGNRNYSRKVRYELYTKEDFSNNLETIQFTLHMETIRKSIFDSLLAPMKIADIPDSDHRIIIEKSVPGNDTSTLRVGFLYTIENVGMSWQLESFPALDTFKVVSFPFQ